MLHPNRFKVNEAWLVFKLNEMPIRTEREGDFNCIVLMDAASCFILGNTFAPAGKAEPSKMAVRRLIKEARAHKRQLPKTLFVPNGQFTSVLPAEAERQACRSDIPTPLRATCHRPSRPASSGCDTLAFGNVDSLGNSAVVANFFVYKIAIHQTRF